MSKFFLPIIAVFIYGFIFTLQGCDQPQQEKVTTGKVVITPEEKEQIITQVYQQQKSLRLCNQERDQALSKDSATIYVLDETQYLVEILCFLGAYQGNYQYFLATKGKNKFQKINFSTFRRHDDDLKLGDTFTLVGMTRFDELNQLLIVETKARGLGDCGSYAQYQWKEDSSFELKEYRDKFECDGVYIEPKNYPLIYP